MEGKEQPCVKAIGSNNNILLEDQLRKAIKKPSSKPEDEFIPIDEFNKILTRQSVQRGLQLCFAKLPAGKELDAWVSAVWDAENESDVSKTRRKIFAVLVLLRAPEKVSLFIDEDLRDEDLPLVPNFDREWECHGQGKARIVECLNDPNQWSGHDAECFYNYQWRVLSPSFDMVDGEVKFYDLHPRIPLPFVETTEHTSEGSLAGGGYGDVWRVSIHPAHFKPNILMKDSTEEFAIKRLRSKDIKQFEAEVESLKRFSKGDYPHLIKLLATYSHDRHHLIFPWAKGGNLKDFWKRNSMPSKSYELALWIANQCRGITEGLRMIHRNEFERSLSPTEPVKGRHGDIKPENILLFEDPGNENHSGFGTLKISDFGLTRWHRDVSNNNIYGHGLAVSLTYRAPECNLSRKISQPWDIWTLGCLFLEFVTWYLCGWDKGVDEFSKLRVDESSSRIPEDNFYNLCGGATESEYGASLKSCVVDWINKLHTTEGCSKFIHDFLDLISDDMLRIRDEKRRDCKEIVDRLDNLFKSCEDETYCFESAHDQPRKRKTNDSDRSDPLDTTVIKIPQVATEQAPPMVITENNRGGSSSHKSEEAPTGNFISMNAQNGNWVKKRNSVSNRVAESELRDTLKQISESPTALYVGFPEIPSTITTPTNPKSPKEISKSPLYREAQDAPEPPLNEASSNSSASTSKLAVTDQRRSSHRVTQQGENPHLQAETLHDGTSGNNTEVEDRSGSSISLPPSGHIRQPLPSNLKAEDERQVNEEVNIESHSVLKGTFFSRWVKRLLCCR